MAQQLSTAFSDLILAVSCMYCTRYLLSLSQVINSTYSYAITFLILVLAASSLGVFRFGATNPLTILVKCHRFISYLASVVGLSFLAAEFYRQAGFPRFGQIHLYASSTVVVLQLFMDHKTHSTLAEFISSSAVVSILLICTLYKNLYGAVGAIVIIFAALIGTEGSSHLGFPAVDLFHYALVLANYCMMHALVKKV